MAIKKINTDLQIEAGLLDGDGNSGTNNQILISTGTGVDWVNASTIIGGPYLPLTAGSSYPLTGDLYLKTTNDASVAREKIVWQTSQGTNRSFIRVGGSYANNALEFGTGNSILGMILHANAGLSIGTTVATTLPPASGLLVQGNVGIGTTSPSEKLEVNGSIKVSNAYPRIYLADTQGVPRSFSVGTSNETFTVRNETGGADVFTIAGADNATTFAGKIYTPDGSPSAPSYSFSGRTDTGMYARAHSSNDRISFATDGSERFYIDGNGTTSVGNSYVGENNSFRNYAGDWGGTTGTANKGFYFLNTASGNTTKALEVTHDGNATFVGDITMTQSSGNNMLFINSSGGGNPVMYMQDSTRKWGQYVSNGDLFFKDETSTIESLKLDGGNGNAIFAGQISAPSSFNFTTNNGYIKVGSSWNTGVLNFLNGPTTYLQFDVPNGRIKNNLGSYLTASSNTGKFGSFDNQSISLVTNNTARLTIDTSGNATFAGDVLASEMLFTTLNGHAHIDSQSSSLMIEAANIQAMGNLIPDGNGNRNLGASNRYWAELYSKGVTSNGNIIVNSNSPRLELGVSNTSTGNAEIRMFSKNNNAANAYYLKYHKDTGIDRLEFIDGSGNANIKFNNGGSASFAGNIATAQTKKLLFDGASGHTYITEESDSNLKFYVGGTEQLNISNGGLHFNSTLTIPSYIYHAGDPNTYLGFPSNNDTIVFATNGSTALTLDAVNAATFTGEVSVKGRLEVIDTDSTLAHVRAFSNTAEGVLTVSNGSNWGFIARGETNAPRIGAWYGGVLKIEGFHSSDGATGSNAIDFAQFQFGNDHFQMNAATSTFAGNVTVAGTLTAQEFHSEFVSASILYESGSTKFGDSSDDNHDFTGSLNILGNITSTGDIDADDITIEDWGSVSASLSAIQTAGGVNGTGTADRIAIWSDSDTLTSNSGLTFTGGHILVNQGTEYRSKDTAGSVRTLMRVNSSNELEYGWSSNGAVKFMGGGSYTERMRIHTNGNVGIGTTNPLYKLTVEGSVAVQNAQNLWIRGGRIGYENAALNNAAYIYNIGASGSSKLNIADSLYVVEAGNVGIGTSNPGHKLDVRGGLRWGSYGSTTTHTYSNIDGAGLYIETVGSTAALSDMRFQARAAGAGNYSYIKIKPSNQIIELGTNNSLGLTINSSNEGIFANNVGINTTNPIDKLNVHGGTGNAAAQQPKIAVTRTSSTGNVLAGKMILTTKPSDPTNHGNLAFQVKTTASSGESSAYYTNAITIDGKNANVGIGTASPANKLDVQITTSNRTTLEPVMSVSAQGSGPYSGFGPKISFNSNIYYGAATGNPAGIIETAYVGAVMGSSPHAYATNSDLVFGTRNGATSVTEKMRILGNGNVGIGTTSPGYKLSVNGDIQIPQNEYIYFDNTAHYIRRGSSDVELQGFNGLNLRTNGSSRLYIKQDGNVGIGTTSPGKKLDVVSTSGTSIVQSLRNPSTSWNQYALTRYGTEGADFRYMDFGYFRGNNNEATRGLVVKSQANATLVTFLDAGNVGIGTTLPSTKLEVAGHVTINSPTGASQTSYGLRLRKTNSSSSVQAGGEILASPYPNNTNAANLIFKTADTVANLTQRMVIDGVGNVGIGDTSPTQISANTFSLSVNSSRTDLSGGLISKANGTVKHQQYWDSSGYSFNLTANSGNFKFNGANVGIGTTTPSSKLEVYGSGSTVLDIQGSQGQLFSITDDLSGTLFAVSDISGVPIFEVEDTGKVSIDGDLKIKSANITYQENIDVDSAATETVATVNTSEYTGAFFDYTCVKGSNARIGTVMAISVGGSIEFTDNSTKDIGDTSGVTLTVDISGGNMRLRATTTTDDWIIKTLIRTL